MAQQLTATTVNLMLKNPLNATATRLAIFAVSLLESEINCNRADFIKKAKLFCSIFFL